MFDLFRSRDKAVRFMLGGLLVIVALSMLVYLIPGAGVTAANDTGDQIIAQIGGEPLTVQDVQRDLDSKMRGQQIPPDLVGVMIPQEVETMIAERATAYEAKRLGFQVTDADLADTIRGIPQFANATPEEYRDVLAQQGLSVPEFESNLRKNQLLLALDNLALEGIVVTPAEVQQEFNKTFEKIKLQYVGFNPDTIKADLKPSPEELKAYFDSHKGYFNIPETRNFELFVADPAKIGATIQISDAQIQQYYDTHKNDFRTPERVHVRHILFMTQGKPKDQIDKIRAKAEDVLKQLKAGADFAKLAMANSDDPGSASKGGDLGWVVRGQMVPNFENASFTQKPGEISNNLITTEYGFHIVQVLEKQDAHLQPLSEVKNQIADELKKGQVNDAVQNAADQARAELAKNPQNGPQIAQKYNLILVNVDNHKNGDTIPEIGTDPEADGAIQSLKKGEVSPVFQAKDKLAFVEVTAVNPSHPAQYSEVESQVRDQYLREKATQIAQEKAKKVRDLLNSNGGNLEAAAKEVGAEVKTTDEFTRGGAAEGLGSAAQLSEAFDKPVGGIVGPTTVGNQTIVGKVVAKVEPDPAKLNEERDTIVRQIKTRKAAERGALFRDGIVTQLEKDGKIKIHKDVLDRLIARYRS